MGPSHGYRANRASLSAPTRSARPGATAGTACRRLPAGFACSLTIRLPQLPSPGASRSQAAAGVAAAASGVAAAAAHGRLRNSRELGFRRVIPVLTTQGLHWDRGNFRPLPAGLPITPPGSVHPQAPRKGESPFSLPALAQPWTVLASLPAPVRPHQPPSPTAPALTHEDGCLAGRPPPWPAAPLHQPAAGSIQVRAGGSSRDREDLPLSRPLLVMPRLG